MKKWITISMIFLSLIFIVLGVIYGGYRDAFVKSIIVCLECIGIG